MMMSTCRRRAQVEWPIFADPKDATTTHPNCSVISFFDFEFKKEDRYFFLSNFFLRCVSLSFLSLLPLSGFLWPTTLLLLSSFCVSLHPTAVVSARQLSSIDQDRQQQYNKLIFYETITRRATKTRQDKIKKKQATNQRNKNKSFKFVPFPQFHWLFSLTMMMMMTNQTCRYMKPRLFHVV